MPSVALGAQGVAGCHCQQSNCVGLWCSARMAANIQQWLQGQRTVLFGAVLQPPGMCSDSRSMLGVCGGV